MSLGILGNYGEADVDDEIKDEDDLAEQTKKSLEAVKPASRPSSDVESSKPKGLVSYLGDDFSDDEDESDHQSDDTTSTTLKPSVVNLGLNDNSNQIPSSLGSSPASGAELSEGADLRREFSDGVCLPPEPTGRCSKMLQEKVAKMLDKKNSGMNVNEYLQKKKAFRNPSIYEKLVSYIGIDEHGTNFPKHIYDPDMWGPESFYDALAKTQKEHHDKKEKEKRESKRAQVEFVTGTKKIPTSSNQPVSTIPEKKSKWDQGPGAGK